MQIPYEIKYVNHNNKSIDLNCAQYRADLTEVQDWEQSYTTASGKVRGFYRDIRQFEIKVLVLGQSEDDGCALRDNLVDILSVDIEDEQTGRLYMDGWYIECFAIASEKDEYWLSEYYSEYTITFISDTSKWTYEHSLYLPRSDQSVGLNYPYDYPYDYAATVAGSKMLENPSITPAPVEITIYGPAVNPTVQIDNNSYSVECTINDGYSLKIDPATLTIMLYDAYGNSENMFGARRGEQYEGSGSYIFHEIPKGHYQVYWDGSFALNVTLFERRDERRWVNG